jgi:hypothetical protein
MLTCGNDPAANQHRAGLRLLAALLVDPTLNPAAVDVVGFALAYVLTRGMSMPTSSRARARIAPPVPLVPPVPFVPHIP